MNRVSDLCIEVIYPIISTVESLVYINSTGYTSLRIRSNTWMPVRRSVNFNIIRS